MAIKNFKLTIYFLRHRHRCSRTTLPADVDETDASILSVEQMLEEEKKHTNPAFPKYADIFTTNWTKNMEHLTDAFRGQRGMTGIPLPYVIRDNEMITPDPDPNADDHGWTTVEDEMINRAPIRIDHDPTKKNAPNCVAPFTVPSLQDE
jgi:hypothetical protein